MIKTLLYFIGFFVVVLNDALKGVFARHERGYRLNAIKRAFDRY